MEDEKKYIREQLEGSKMSKTSSEFMELRSVHEKISDRSLDTPKAMNYETANTIRTIF